MGVEFDLSWFGTLTRSNIDAVCGLLQQLLSDKSYTFVAANELFGFKPEVRVGQRLEPSRSNGLVIRAYHSEHSSGFNVCDTYGVWGCSTTAVEPTYDPSFQAPYFSFEHEKVTITHRSASGNLIYWVVAVEPSSASST